MFTRNSLTPFKPQHGARKARIIQVMGLSVIGAGFGRTGTLSTKNALELLGYSPCYHMMEVAKHPEHTAMWVQAARGAAVDWRVMFKHHAAAVDWPACAFWPALADTFPDAKVLLTVRDPERWYESVANTIYPSLTAPNSEADPARLERRAMARELILRRTFDGRFSDRSYAIDVYQRHIESVVQSVDANRLLVFEVSQGWAPLCEFLGRPVPDEPFPRMNSTKQFKERRPGQGQDQ